MLSLLLKSHHLSRSNLAHRLNVSVQTVHNWCSGRVSIPTRKIGQLCALLEDMGVPSDELSQMVVRELEAQGLAPGRFTLKAQGSQPTVMLMTWNLMNSGLFGPITIVVRNALEGLGYQCLVVDCTAEHRLRRAYIRQAVATGVAGLLLCGVPGDVPDPDDDLFSSLGPAIAADIPVVLLKPWTGSVSLPPGVGSIGWDSVAAVERAVGVLANLGHSRIRAVLGGTGAGFGGRYRGLDKAWANLGLPFDEDALVWESDTEASPELTEAFASATAIFTPPSHLSLLVRACYAAGVRWPDDISIISLGNREVLPQHDRRPFTFVTIPIGRVGRGAAQLLSSMIERERFQTGQEYIVYGASTMSIENLDGGSVGQPRTHELPPAPAHRAPLLA